VSILTLPHHRAKHRRRRGEEQALLALCAISPPPVDGPVPDLGPVLSAPEPQYRPAPVPPELRRPRPAPGIGSAVLAGLRAEDPNLDDTQPVDTRAILDGLTADQETVRVIRDAEPVPVSPRPTRVRVASELLAELRTYGGLIPAGVPFGAELQPVPLADTPTRTASVDDDAFLTMLAPAYTGPQRPGSCCPCHQTPSRPQPTFAERLAAIGLVYANTIPAVTR
jgi:hypothetical protein